VREFTACAGLEQARRFAARTSTRLNATEATAKNTKIRGANGRAFAANPLGEAPAHTVALYPDLYPYPLCR